MSTRANNSMSQRIENVTSIINVISKVIVVDACNKTERFKTEKKRSTKLKHYACTAHTAFFLWNKTSDIFLLIIFICACVIVHVYVISLTGTTCNWCIGHMKISLSLHCMEAFCTRARARENLYSSLISFAWYSTQRRKEHFFFLFLSFSFASCAVFRLGNRSLVLLMCFFLSLLCCLHFV